MKPLAVTLALSLCLLPGLDLMAQESDASDEQAGTPIEALIAQMAEELDREFVIDPRIRGIRTFTTSNDLDYESLLGILRINNVVAIETGEQIHVMPEQNMRVSATRILQEDDSSVSDHEVVTRIIAIPQLPEAFDRPAQSGDPSATNPFATIPPTSAAQLVPVLRPMMSQAAMLGAVANTNVLILVDRYDNVRRITAMIEEIIESVGD